MDKNTGAESPLNALVLVADDEFRRITKKHGFTVASDMLQEDVIRTYVCKRLRESLENCLTTAALNADKNGKSTICSERDMPLVRKRVRMCLWPERGDQN
jgi:histone H3/H4